LLILGSGKIGARSKILGSVLDPIIQVAPCDVGIMNIKGDGKIKRVLVPTAGGPNAKLALEWGSWIVRQNKGRLMLLSVASDEGAKKRSESCLVETKKEGAYDEELVDEKIVYGRNVVSTILKESKGYDLILIGASKEGLWKRFRFGTFPEKLTRLSSVSVLVVRKHEGPVLSWIRRFLAG
jgi:nucleotide-binding universal stress UspA family protein